jgi:hypothetical protein
LPRSPRLSDQAFDRSVLKPEGIDMPDFSKLSPILKAFFSCRNFASVSELKSTALGFVLFVVHARLPFFAFFTCASNPRR